MYSTLSKINAKGLLLVKGKLNNLILLVQTKFTLYLLNSCQKTDKKLWKREAIKSAPSPFLCCELSSITAIILLRRGQKSIFLP